MLEFEEYMNLTPHAIKLGVSLEEWGGETQIVTVPPSGLVARVMSVPGKVLYEYLVPIVGAPTWGEVIDLPPPKGGVVYIVSLLVASRVSREDVVSPGTGPADGARRDEKGQIMWVTRLIRSC